MIEQGKYLKKKRQNFMSQKNELCTRFRMQPKTFQNVENFRVKLKRTEFPDKLNYLVLILRSCLYQLN